MARESKADKLQRMADAATTFHLPEQDEGDAPYDHSMNVLTHRFAKILGWPIPPKVTQALSKEKNETPATGYGRCVYNKLGRAMQCAHTATIKIDGRPYCEAHAGKVLKE